MGAHVAGPRARWSCSRHPDNEASQRLAERAGFTREGTLRRYRRRHGVREDLVMFSMLAEDLAA